MLFPLPYFLSTTSVMAKSMFRILSLTEVFLLVLSASNKYILVQQGKNWSDAQAFCKANYIDLAIAKVSDDIDWLIKETQKQQFTSSAWIGLYNDQSYHWSLGNQPLGDVTGWCSPEPSYGMEDCVALNQWCWFDGPCFLQFSFVCFDARNSGSSRFIVISTAMTFQDAQIHCRQFHTDLASVTTLEENSIIQQIVSGNSWIGLFRDGWKWTDQSKISGWPWGVDPWNVPIDHTCGSFINGLVNPAPCSDIKPFFCLRDFTKKQIVRIKVQSDRDVNDPAVKSEILQKFKQKLEEMGISSNITLKWREKPDGKVFHKIKEKDAMNVTGEKCDL